MSAQVTRLEYLTLMVQILAAAATMLAAWAAYRSASASERAVYEAARLSYRLSMARDVERFFTLRQELNTFKDDWYGPDPQGKISATWVAERVAELLEPEENMPRSRRVAAGEIQEADIDLAIAEVGEKILGLRRVLDGGTPPRPDIQLSRWRRLTAPWRREREG